jgi:hypothetical protein
MLASFDPLEFNPRELVKRFCARISRERRSLERIPRAALVESTIEERLMIAGWTSSKE